MRLQPWEERGSRTWDQSWEQLFLLHVEDKPTLDVKSSYKAALSISATPHFKQWFLLSSAQPLKAGTPVRVLCQFALPYCLPKHEAMQLLRIKVSLLKNFLDYDLPTGPIMWHSKKIKSNGRKVGNTDVIGYPSGLTSSNNNHAFNNEHLQCARNHSQS